MNKLTVLCISAAYVAGCSRYIKIWQVDVRSKKNYYDSSCCWDPKARVSMNGHYEKELPRLRDRNSDLARWEKLHRIPLCGWKATGDIQVKVYDEDTSGSDDDIGEGVWPVPDLCPAGKASGRHWAWNQSIGDPAWGSKALINIRYECPPDESDKLSFTLTGAEWILRQDNPDGAASWSYDLSQLNSKDFVSSDFQKSSFSSSHVKESSSSFKIGASASARGSVSVGVKSAGASASFGIGYSSSDYELNQRNKAGLSEYASQLVSSTKSGYTQRCTGTCDYKHGFHTQAYSWQLTFERGDGSSETIHTCHVQCMYNNQKPQCPHGQSVGVYNTQGCKRWASKNIAPRKLSWTEWAGKAKDVAISSMGHYFVAGTDNNLYKLQQFKWRLNARNCHVVAISAAGSPACIAGSGKLSIKKKSQWYNPEQRYAVDVAWGKRLYFLDKQDYFGDSTDPCYKVKEVQWWFNNKVVTLNGCGRRLTSLEDRAVVIGADGQIWKNGARGWLQLGDGGITFNDIAGSDTGGLFGIAAGSDKVMKWYQKDNKWVEVSGAGARIAAGGKGKVMIATSTGTLYHAEDFV